MNEPRRKALVSDFDGTMTRHDFYQLVVERLLPTGTPDYWADYRAGRITHFEALNAYFAAARPDEAEVFDIVRAMKLDPDLKPEVEALRAAGWDVVVASAGCLWYINRLFREVVVELEVHANLGKVVGGRLVMELPRDSPFYSPDNGIDKAAIVRQAQGTHVVVAFAGDGPPDLAAALLVEPELRFARGQLAVALQQRGAEFQPFDRWSDVSRALVQRGDA